MAAVIYWPLMKGLLAGRLPRDHVFAPADGRAKYPMFQGSEWQRNQDFLDELRVIAGVTSERTALFLDRKLTLRAESAGRRACFFGKRDGHNTGLP